MADKALPQGDPSTLPPPPDPGEDAVRWYFYTSGTTADPKGAMHTDRTIKAGAVGMCERLEITEADVNAVVFPFTHIGGIGWLFSALVYGFPTVYIERFDPAKTIEMIQRHSVTLAGAGTPFHMAYLAAQRQLPEGQVLFPSVRAYPGGGAPKPPQLHYDIKAEMGGAGVVSGYGLTEAPIVAMGSVHDSDEQLAHTEGKATGTAQLRTVTLEGKEAGIGEEGEIRAKAPQLMKGYLDSSARRRGLRRGRVVQDRRPRAHRRRRDGHDHRSGEGHHHPQHGERLGQGGGGRALPAPRHRRRRGDRRARSPHR